MLFLFGLLLAVAAGAAFVRRTKRRSCSAFFLGIFPELYAMGAHPALKNNAKKQPFSAVS
jgi:hypothetical protein